MTDQPGEGDEDREVPGEPERAESGDASAEETPTERPADRPNPPEQQMGIGFGKRLPGGDDTPKDQAGQPTGDPLGGLLDAMLGPGGQLPPEFAENLPPGFENLPGMNDPQMLQQMLSSVQQMLAGGGDGPVNWDVAAQLARQAAAEGGDPSVGEIAHRQVAEALRTADLWLDRVCDLPAASARTEAWSRAEWIENTLPVWKVVVEPVANSVGEAMGKALTAQAPEQLQAVLGDALPMMKRMGGAFFGAQLGQALGALSREVIGGGDIGLPLLPAGRAALLPTNLAAFGEGLGLPEDEVRLYLALREAAHARLVAGVPWLRAHLLAAVEEYARGITIDMSTIESAVREIDPSNVESLQNALASDLFEPERTPQQQAALDRMETALALVEGWTDEVVERAAAGSLPHAVAMGEAMRRRRAAGGPAEHTFASLVGLELRPRRLREAAAVWHELTEARGSSGRDALWSHPDITPDETAFADPVGFATRTDATDDIDDELARMLDGGLGDGPAEGPPEGDTPPPPAG
ncbi:zinc-dependent metalloprotease [Spongisporangium articulatum]|uniref:Zinc-dependent metalloprotease n=1 Tax=Spongisporangium articulatum TaxID=3362603 RepID=A0ABW8APP5_9ACTN